MKDDRLYLTHIVESIERITEYTQGGEQAFLTTRMIQDAVIRNFEIIGEASGRISPETMAQADVPWAQMKSFRNFLIHQYTGVDAKTVWKVIHSDLPALASRIAALLAHTEAQ
ncbi:MAG: DUF86 domain-containing protein [Rhodospirillaceae bacterium]|nr:DUF86 domain-containing protein [Rhodospirillales bacterium]